MLPDHNKIRDEFPFCRKITYFDAAHFTPYPRRAVTRLNEFFKDFTEDYLNLSLVNINEARQLRQAVAEMINASPDDIIITSNTTHGINIFANGFSFDKSSNNVAVLDSEFPSVVYPWLNQERLGKCNLMLIPSDKGYANEALIKRTLVDYNIKVFTISYVQFLGYRYNIKSIADFCRKRDIYLIVDAIQAAGVYPIDVQKSGIDYLCAGNQKWLMSPAGLGFTYMSRNYREKINPTYVGTTNVNYNFENFLDYKLDFKQSGEAYENSTLNTIAMIGTTTVIKYFMELGVENIYRHITDIQDLILKQLDDRKYKVESDLSPEHRSNILLLSHTDIERNREIQKKLQSQKIYIALREGYLRISPHIYNNHEDAEKLAEALNNA